MGNGDSPLLLLTLTNACNLHCGFCPISLGSESMSLETARRAVSVYLDRFPRARPRIRFFGGEPLLNFGVLREIVEGFPAERGRPGPEFSFPTNGTIIDNKILGFLKKHPHVEAAVSRVRRPKELARLRNVLVSVCIPPSGAGRFAPYVGRLLKAGFRKLNFLPAFFVRWNARQLKSLERSFKLTGALLHEWRRRGQEIEVRNAATFNPVPLFNHGAVVDVDGGVYPSNAVLCSAFRHLAPRLRMGSVAEPEKIDWGKADGIRWDELFRDSLDAEVYRSTGRVNERLTEFVRGLPSSRARGEVHGPATCPR